MCASVVISLLMVQDDASLLRLCLQEARACLALVGQPHAFLIEQLSVTKARAGEAEARCEAARVQLSERGAEAAELASERDALRRDLDALLVQRAGLDRMKQLVMRAVGANGGGGGGGLLPPGGAAGGGAAPFLIQGTGAHGLTTIL